VRPGGPVALRCGFITAVARRACSYNKGGIGSGIFRRGNSDWGVRLRSGVDLLPRSHAGRAPTGDIGSGIFRRGNSDW